MTTLQTLRDALKNSPDNLPLRQHLAESLVGRRLDEADKNSSKRFAATQSSGIPRRLGGRYYSQGKNARLGYRRRHAEKPDTPARA